MDPINENLIISKIYFIRGQKVMLDEDLAEMYRVETKRINEQVKRNLERFPNDFMFQLTKIEFENLKSQFATSNWGGRRKLPFVFSEHGVLMLSSVLSSSIAIQVNIRIIRIFTKLRELIASHKDILLKLEHLENNVLKQNEKQGKNEKDIQMIFNALKNLLEQPKKTRIPIGFKSQKL